MTELCSNLGATLSSYNVFSTSYVSIIFPLYLLYFKVENFRYINLCSYDNFSHANIRLVARFRTLQGCRGYGDSHGDSHGYGYGMGMGTAMNPYGFCG